MAFGEDNVPIPALDDILPAGAFRWFIESAPDGIVIADSDGRILLFNAQAESIFGLSEEEVLHQPIEVLVPERFRDKHIRDRTEYSREPRTRPMGLGLELSGVRRDGVEFPVEISLSPVTTENGLLVMAIVRDITIRKREHFISQTLQKAMVSPIPEDLQGIRIASAYHSAHVGALVGGDFFDVFEVGPSLVALAIGDVSGKGVGAAVHTALAKYSLRAYAYEDPSPACLVERLNKTVHRQLEQDMFITLLYGLIDLDKRTFSFANAGHMPPLYLSRTDHEVGEIALSGTPLGVFPDCRYDHRDLNMHSGDRMLLYSDGVTEARNDTGLFGPENLRLFFHDKGLEPPDHFVNHLIDRLMQWSGEQLYDDTAMLMVAVD